MRAKKYLIIIIIFAMITIAIFPATHANAVADYSYIKVKLSSMGSVTSVKFTVNGEYYIKENPYYTLIRGKTYTIKTTSSGVTLVDGSNSSYIGTSATFIRCESSNSVNWLTLDNTKTGWTNYPGDMTFKKNESYIVSICKLFIEKYLVGVVAYEMSPNWPEEALKAQAVAARTYAMRYIYSGNEYDVVDTTSNQVYKGYDPERDAKVEAAVKATKGLAMYYGTNFADGAYSASNGGQTQPRKPVWGSVNLYHELKDDPYDIANLASPRFEFYFPKIITTTNKLDTKLENMMLEAMSKKLSVEESSITILGISNIEPYGLPADTKYGEYPDDSRKLQNIRINLDYTTTGVTIPGGTTTETPTSTVVSGIVVLQSSSRLRIRSGAGTSYSIIGYVPNGGKVAISDQRSDGWFKITYNGINGYVYGEYVKIDAPIVTPSPTTVPTPTPSPTPTPEIINKYAIVSTNGDSVAMRENANDNSSTLTYIPNEKGVHVLSKSFDGWYFIEYSSLQGFIKEDECTLIETKPTPEISTETSQTPAPTTTPKPSETPNPSNKQVVISLNFDDMQEVFKDESSYLKYHSILDVYTSSDDKTLVLRAGRYGHGIGMSQRGAQEMAKQGFSYEEILQFYYKGTTLTNMIISEQDLPVKAELPSTVGVVTANSLNVRSGPGSSYSIVTNISNGVSVNIIIEDTWSKIYIPSKKIVGYVAKKYLDITYPVTTPTPETTFEVHQGIYKVTATRLNVRTGPSTDYKVIGTLENGENVTKYDASGTFYKIKDSRGNEGWCSSKYLIMVSGAITPSPSPMLTPTQTPSPSATPSATLEPTVEPTEEPTQESTEEPTVEPTQEPTEEPTAIPVDANIGWMTDDDKLYSDTVTYSEVLATISSEYEVTIVQDLDNGWVEVIFQEIQGYVIDDNLIFDGIKEDIEVYLGPWAKVSSGTQIIYNEPSVEAYELASINEGNYVKLLNDRDDGFIKVDYESIVGYMVDDDMEFEGTKEDTSPLLTPNPTPTPTPSPTPSPSPTSSPTPSPTPTPTPTADEQGTDDPSELLGTVTADTSSVRLRKSASLQSSILAYVPVGTQVVILEDCDDGWVHINYNDLLGYMIDDFVDFEGTKEDHEDDSNTTNDDDSVITGTITLSFPTSRLRIRSSASTSASILGHVLDGTKVKVLNQLSNGWLKIEYSGLTGYVSGNYVQINTASSETIGTIANCSLLNVRSGPSTTYKVLGQMQSGKTVTILGSSNGWYKINFEGKDGWLSGKYVSVYTNQSQDTTTTGTGKVTASSLRVRSGAGLNYSQIGSLPKNTTVNILGETNGFYKIIYSGKTGYISKTYVDMI